VKKAKAVKVGRLIMGGEFPVSVQTMWKRPLERPLDGTVRELDRLAEYGCDLVRFAVPDTDQAELLGELAGMTGMPLVADIHFDHRLALRCMDFPVAKVRINPGNIGARWKVEEVVRKALDRGVAIRVGVNSGSLPASLRDEPDRAAAMVKAAEGELETLESLGFSDIVVSLKASDADLTVAANRLFAERFEYPLHLGVTEAGPLIPGIVKSTYALAKLLEDGIGSTIRVSLSDAPEKEVLAGRSILGVLPGGRRGVNIVSCPRCGRASFDTHAFLEKAQDWLYRLDRDVTVAVMGCVVNGPGEARHADIGITGAGNTIIIFRKGEIVRRVTPDEAFDAFREELERS
jgi:(E)-4-hydroxy-3-methylbut-2-enyl-diphosphate synthase